MRAATSSRSAWTTMAGRSRALFAHETAQHVTSWPWGQWFSGHPHTSKIVYYGFESRLAHPFFVLPSFLSFFLPSFLPVPVVTLVVTTSWLSSVVSSSGAIGHSGGTRKGGSCGNRAFASDCSASRRIQPPCALPPFYLWLSLQLESPNLLFSVCF